MLHAIIQYSTHHYSTNTNLKRIRCNFTENIFGTGELKIEWSAAFSQQGAWHFEIEVLLTSFNNVYIISFEKYQLIKFQHNWLIRGWNIDYLT